LVGLAGSSELHDVEASVFLSAMVFLSGVVDRIGLDEVDVGVLQLRAEDESREISVGRTGLGENVVKPEVRDTHEMAEVARDEFQVVKEGRGCDLQIGVGKDVPASLQTGSDLPEDPSG
jgi:hypothetical protein